MATMSNIQSSGLLVELDNLADGKEIQQLDGKKASETSRVENAFTPSAQTAEIERRPVIIARSQRRGLLAQFCLLSEVDNARLYSRRRKWFITFIVAFAASTPSIGSAVILPSLAQVTVEFSTSPALTNLSIAIYQLSLAIFPLWWSSFAETTGRRTIHIISFALFVIFSIFAATSTNISMLLVARMLSGGAAAAVQAVGAGTLADVWEPRERGKSVSLFYLGPMTGPLLAPIIGGGLAEVWDWRSTQWFQAIFGAAVLSSLILAQPETLPRRDDMAVSQNEPSAISRLRRIFLDPLKVLLYLRFPAVFLTVYYASLAFGSLYLLNISLQRTFAEAPYDFSTAHIGLVYIPSSLGFLLMAIVGGKWSDVIMEREAVKAGRYNEHGNLVYRPEDRMMENAWLAAIMFPAGLIIYGWTVDKGVHWAIPMIGTFFFGCGTMLISSLAMSMLTEFLPHAPSTGVAVNNFLRNIFSSAGSVIAEPLLRVLGNGWLFTGLGFICSCSAILVWAMRRFGPRWRKSMEAVVGV